MDIFGVKVKTIVSKPTQVLDGVENYFFYFPNPFGFRLLDCTELYLSFPNNTAF